MKVGLDPIEIYRSLGALGRSGLGLMIEATWQCPYMHLACGTGQLASGTPILLRL